MVSEIVRQCLDHSMVEVIDDAGAAPVFLIGEDALLSEARDALASIGMRVVGDLGWQQAADAIDLPAACLVVIEARGVAEDFLATALPRITAAARTIDAPMIVTVDHASIDIAAALINGRAQLLCEPSMADRVVAAAFAAQSAGHRVLHDNAAYEGEAARLRRLNDEVARIAQVLSRLTRADAANQRDQATVADRRPTFGIEPITDIAIDAAEVRRAIRARRMRDPFFGAGLFEEPGWDMVLDLFAAELEGTRVSVSSLCIAAAVAPTTALRWISKLTEAGLFERQPDPFDRRRAYMELSERASKAMRKYVGTLRRAGLSLA